MANIIQYGAQYINLDYLVRAYPNGKETILEMANGKTIRMPKDIDNLLSGRQNVVQAFPVEGLYTIYNDKDGRYKEKVLFMGVCANGEIRPLSGLQDEFVYFMDEAGMYEGLSDTNEVAGSDGDDSQS